MKDNITKNCHYRIQNIIKKFTGNYSEDLEQDVYVRIYKNKNNYEEKNKFLQWVSVITANICRDYLKSSYFKNSANSCSDDEAMNNIATKENPEKIYSQKERQKIILKAVDSLPKKSREVIVLFEFEDYSYEQISKKLNIPIGTVKSRINSARAILKEKLQFLLED